MTIPNLDLKPTKALEDNGFKIINLQRKNYFYNEEYTTDLIIIATK